MPQPKEGTIGNDPPFVILHSAKSSAGRKIECNPAIIM
jgi:hypothetical protein